MVLQGDEGQIRRSVLCCFKGVKRRCVMTSLTVNTMNPIGKERTLLISERITIPFPKFS